MPNPTVGRGYRLDRDRSLNHWHCSLCTMAPLSLLDNLRTRTAIDCDTLDLDIGKHLGPFQDCTSNQAIAFNELQDPKYDALLKEAVTSAKNLCNTDFERATPAELAVELSVC